MRACNWIGGSLGDPAARGFESNFRLPAALMHRRSERFYPLAGTVAAAMPRGTPGRERPPVHGSCRRAGMTPRAVGHSASPIQSFLDQLHREFAALDSGQVATYIPELAKADPAKFGIVIATVDGQVYEAGDARQTFTLQSVSKPLVYGVALEDRGAARVLQAIGVEPSGDAFNSISLEPGTGRPRNPMINAGAIATASLVAGGTREERLARVLSAVSAYAGRTLGIDEAVYESERITGHRNRAIGHMLRNYDVLADDPEDALDLYFRQCSILVDCRDLALMAATLANAGVNPLTGQRAVASQHIASILSLMTTCGMYDFSGEWVYRVGMPAKSGVGGGIIAVLPGQLGIGVYSPALDERGNSVRGVQVCQAMSSRLGLHFLQPPRAAAATVRARYTLATVRSKRRRPPAENAVLESHGPLARVYELQGDLSFATIEPLLREIVDDGADLHYAVLDFKRVTHADATATRLLANLVSCCDERGQQLLLTRVRRGELLADFGNLVAPHRARAVSFHPQLDMALELCERGLVQRYGGGAPLQPGAEGVRNDAPTAQPSTGLSRHRLCAGASLQELAVLEAVTERHLYDPGSTLVQRGDPADRLFFLTRGEVSVVVGLPQGGWKRLSTLTAGMGFGETALTVGGQRTADVRADTEVECRTLDLAAFARLQQSHPALVITLLRNLLRNSSETAARLTGEVAALEA